MTYSNGPHKCGAVIKHTKSGLSQVIRDEIREDLQTSTPDKVYTKHVLYVIYE